MPQSTSITELLSPSALADVDNYQLSAKVVVEGFMSGQHRSLFHGSGSEFVQYRDYTPGDDLKYVDWKVFGKRDRLYSKVFEEETNMDCTIVLDASASMNYQGKRSSVTKLRYGSMIAACLAYLAAKQGDNLGFYGYAEELLTVLPAARPASRLKRIFTALQALPGETAADHQQHLTYIAKSLKRRGMLILISDFLEVEQEVPELLKSFQFNGKETIVIQILDPDELDLPFDHTLRFEDSETGVHITTSPEAIRQDYQTAMQNSLTCMRDACHSIQADYLQVATSHSLGSVLAAYLHRRGSVF